jgi:hypothetical protein
VLLAAHNGARLGVKLPHLEGVVAIALLLEQYISALLVLGSKFLLEGATLQILQGVDIEFLLVPAFGQHTAREFL